LKVIGALVTALAQGRGGVPVIEGPPGIGKSRLLTEVMALADKGGSSSVRAWSIWSLGVRRHGGRGHRLTLAGERFVGLASEGAAAFSIFFPMD
jgi:hypothetical protein